MLCLSRNLDKNPLIIETTWHYTVREAVIMEKPSSEKLFISALLFSAVAGTLLVGLVSANPISGPPDMYTEPPTVTIHSTAVNGDNVTINFKAKVGKSTTAEHTQLNRIYYTTDWNQSATYVYECLWLFDSQEGAEFSYILNVTDIPEGNHTITVHAEEYGYYESGVGFHITGFSNVNFTVDTVPPNVLVLSIENKIYDAPDLPLNFTVSEPTSKMSYVLDGQDDVTVDGNTTLTGLTEGEHTITVYVWDAAGNVGASETLTFTVESFPAVPVAVASLGSIAVVGVGLLVYFKKRKH